METDLRPIDDLRPVRLRVEGIAHFEVLKNFHTVLRLTLNFFGSGEEVGTGHGRVIYHRIIHPLQPQFSRCRGHGELHGGLHARAQRQELFPNEREGSDKAEARR